MLSILSLHPTQRFSSVLEAITLVLVICVSFLCSTLMLASFSADLLVIHFNGPNKDLLIKPKMLPPYPNPGPSLGPRPSNVPRPPVNSPRPVSSARPLMPRPLRPPSSVLRPQSFVSTPPRSRIPGPVTPRPGTPIPPRVGLPQRGFFTPQPLPPNRVNVPMR